MAQFFVDENDLALGKLLATELGNVVYPGHAEFPQVPRGTVDDEWLPVIGRLKLVVITRDQRIRYRPAEKKAWIDYRVRGFVLTGKKSQTTADSKAIIHRHWTQIMEIVERNPDGPMDAGSHRDRNPPHPHLTTADRGDK